MDSLKLLPSQRNGIFKLIQDRGFHPGEFEWQEFRCLAGGTMPQLLHVPTGFWFRINRHANLGFLVTYAPANETYEAKGNPGDWPGVLRYASEWLAYLKRETETPDLWDALTGENELLQGSTGGSSDNLPFEQSELPHVRKCLEELKAYVIKTKDLTESQRKIVDARFDHMEEAATRMGRKDWVAMVIGSLMGVAFSLALNGDGTRDLFGFAALVIKRALGTMLYLTGPH